MVRSINIYFEKIREKLTCGPGSPGTPGVPTLP